MNNTKRQRRDFVKWLDSQLRTFRTRRFEKLDVEEVGCELEAVVGRYKYEVNHRAERLIPILMRAYHVYGDWNDLQFEWDMLRSALKDSPSSSVNMSLRFHVQATVPIAKNTGN